MVKNHKYASKTDEIYKNVGQEAVLRDKFEWLLNRARVAWLVVVARQCPEVHRLKHEIGRAHV